MNNKEYYIKRLKEKYGIDFDEFMDLFYSGLSQRNIAKHYNVTRDIIRYIGRVFNLNWGDREHTISPSTTLKEEYVDEQLFHKLFIENKKLKYTNSVLRRQIEKLSQYQVFSDVNVDYISEKLSSININSIFKNKLRTVYKPKHIDNFIEDVLILSDWHIGEKVNVDPEIYTHSMDIVSERIDKLLDKIFLYRKGDTLHLLLLGDFVEGGHQEELLSDESNIFEYVMFVYEQINKIILNLYKMGYEKINVYCVVGNHSRVKPVKYYKNKYMTFESFVYAMLLNQHDKQFNIKFYKNNFGIFEIGKQVIAFTHGDILKSYNSNQVSKFQSEIVKFYNKRFNSLIMGHYHIPTIISNDWNGYTIINGSLKGSDEYSIFNNMGVTDPVQIMFSLNREGHYEFNFLKV